MSDVKASIGTSIRVTSPGRDLTADGLRQVYEILGLLAHDVFKKTPCVADLKPAGRVVAKDLINSAKIPFLTITPNLTRAISTSQQVGDSNGIDAVAGTLYENLTDPEWAKRKTEDRPRATHDRSDKSWNYAQQVGSAVADFGHQDGAYEKQYYADI
ncbi:MULTISPECIES: hypothetical protein [Rhodopseudomonas]|uniref:Uncharacterized protein n=1 Tax=Rhodopseudomonas palustris TaxID=1076 RepID=A0A0D7F3L1_RHOPL|nr:MULTISPECIES: hypothetical protein [Rhodopseudomonas]KIZ47370.1 hypothetical protein OO17_04750 [Rhodopseudomonas palustris]MDF3809228.1 hypothetical protein [Rhodopseudomonas sp. BAL398]WOK19088.1 hypothetical protein RBJ75_06090 [Rhodopseudomonas sp. BAL398]